MIKKVMPPKSLAASTYTCRLTFTAVQIVGRVLLKKVISKHTNEFIQERSRMSARSVGSVLVD